MKIGEPVVPDESSLQGRLLTTDNLIRYALDDSYRQQSEFRKRNIREYARKAITELEEIVELLNDSIRED